DTIQNAIDLFQKRIDILKQIMEESGVSSESIKSNQINFNQVYYGNPQYSLYNTYTRIIVSASIDDFESLSKAIDVPGVSIETMSFTISDETLDKTRKDLVQKALENAIVRANDVAESAGLKVKSIRSIEVGAPISQGGYNTIVYRGVSISPAYDNSIYNLGQLSVTIHAEFEMGK
ncbi:MAG: SIMPL domain-containing protein, partial [Candidatus Nitrosotenuis sp.]